MIDLQNEKFNGVRLFVEADPAGAYKAYIDHGILDAATYSLQWCV